MGLASWQNALLLPNAAGQLKPSFVILTYIPAPYQVELFDALSAAMDGRIAVIYRIRSAPDRQWHSPQINHAHCFLEDGDGSAQNWVETADLVIFGSYQTPTVSRLIDIRARSRKPWVFWGERPGVCWKGIAGRLLRRVSHRRLHGSAASIWGIGNWAVEGYRREFGTERIYENVPYFSNLQPYLQIDRKSEGDRHPKRLLFSGSLIKRKGVDILARAFTRFISEGGDARLTLMGAGPLEGELRAVFTPVADRVEIVGFRQWADLPRVYAGAEILCAPSRYDGWGLVVMEGLAAGMPVISTTSTGAAREFISSRTGWLVRPNDEWALLDAIRSATNLEGDQFRRFSIAARSAAQQQTIEAGVDRFLHSAERAMSSWRS